VKYVDIWETNILINTKNKRWFIGGLSAELILLE